MENLNGTYRPNFSGARTIADAKPLMVNGEFITANVERQTTITIFIGCTIVFSGELPARISKRYQVNSFVVEYITANYPEKPSTFYVFNVMECTGHAGIEFTSRDLAKMFADELSDISSSGQFYDYGTIADVNDCVCPRH